MINTFFRSMWQSYIEERNQQTTNNLELDNPSPQDHLANLMGHYTPTFDRPGMIKLIYSEY